LTEIKQSAELLWRNNVAPEKVVLGLGFYGRSFQLKNKGCDKPGCTFSGAAKKGSCTGNAGTLAYFEIQDILKDQDPAVTWDKEAAVNYMVFDDDQWVSYDNKKTFKQKVDWANSVGLGGVMIWSIDQDDNEFSALTGLLGRSPGDFDSITKKSAVTDTGHWASMNGQKCIETDCATVPLCPTGYQLAPFDNPKSFKDDCGGSESRVICCPVDAMPESCTWRGGESSRSCHGQCHAGEMTLFHSRHATTNCYRPGFQAACCSAGAYTNLIDACYVGKTSDTSNGSGANKQSCPSGYSKISEVFKYSQGDITYLPGAGLYFPICCPSSSAFENCHWVGKGTCDDNECSDSDVEFMTDEYGMSTSQCASGLNGRKKVLCCNPPKHVSPFLPVALDKIFPTLPPESDYPEFDLQHLGGDQNPTVDEPNQQTFGMVVIDGPPGTVDNLKRRDGSYLTVLDCEDIAEHGSSTARLVCPDSGAEEPCGVGNGVAEGTIIHMPDGCGPGSYAVVHNIRRSENQKIPSHVKRTLPGPSLVHDLELSYDFKRVKRDSGEIYIRIDYSNEFNYWKSIVQGDPVKSKRDGYKRFYSSNAEDWKRKFDSLRNSPGLSSLHNENFHNTILSTKADTCKNASWMKVDVGGDITEEMKFGYSFVGTISPTFNIEEAYGFFDSKLLFQGSIAVDTRGVLEIDPSLQAKELFTGSIAGYGFSHPGICDLGPSFNVKARLIGAGHSLDAKFTANVIASNDGYTKSNQPSSLGHSEGGVTNDNARNPFEGHLSVNPTTEPSAPSDPRNKRDSGTVLALQLAFESRMQIDLNVFKSTLHNFDSQTNHEIDSFMRIKDDGGVTWTNNRVTLGVIQTGDLPGWDVVEDHQVGDNGQVKLLHQSNGDTLDVNRNSPVLEDDAIFNAEGFITCLGSKNASKSPVCLAPTDLVRIDPTLAQDPETGNPYSDQYGDAYSRRDFSDLVRRTLGGRRPFSTRDANGAPFNLRQSLPYYYGNAGADLLAHNPNAGHHAASDFRDCEDLTTTNDSDDPTLLYVTEHGLELQYLPRLLEFLQTGRNRDPDGITYVSNLRPVPRDLLDDNSYFQTDYAVWDPTGTRTGVPNDLIWQAFGSGDHPERNVNAEQTLNSYKARLFAGTTLMADNTWEEHGYNQWNLPDSVERADAALSVINQVKPVLLPRISTIVDTETGLARF
jgi:chitinase